MLRLRLEAGSVEKRNALLNDGYLYHMATKCPLPFNDWPITMIQLNLVDAGLGEIVKLRKFDYPLIGVLFVQVQG